MCKSRITEFDLTSCKLRAGVWVAEAQVCSRGILSALVYYQYATGSDKYEALWNLARELP